MLVLTRRKNEAIVLNERFVVSIVDIKDDKVRLGIDAPLGASVYRREVYEAITTASRAQQTKTAESPSAPPPLPQQELADRTEQRDGMGLPSSSTEPLPPPTTLTVSPRHLSILDAYCTMMQERYGISMNREQALASILDSSNATK